MKKPENTIIEIQDKEFIVSEAAQVILASHIRSISRAYRLNPRAKRELLNALRDLLLELPQAKQKTISERTAQSVIHIVGNSYENESRLQPLNNSVTKGKQALRRGFRRYVLTEKVRRNTFYVLSVIMLIPIGLGIGSLDYFTKDLYYDIPTGQLIETNLGPVKQHVVPTSELSKKSDEIDTPKQYTAISIIVVTILLSILFYSLAKRSPRTKFIVALLVVASFSSWTISDNENRALDIAITAWTGYQPKTFAPNTPRTETDLDTLYACGADIRYVFLDGSDGIFYTLRDAGYSLSQEIPGGIEPEKDELCKLYDSLRKEMPNERILMSYIRDADGTIRPYDNTATYDQLTISKELAKQRYGFFVKEDK